ncbi:MAG: BamA/TamA family outer membrane protein [Flavisolibacter sp.]
MNVPAAKSSQIIYVFFVIVASVFVFSSCGVKDYPQKPFVYDYKINIIPKGKYSTEEEKVLKDQLDQQLHDSIRVRRQRKFLVAKILKNPPVFDSVNMSTSQRYMRTMLHTLGYMRDSIHPSYRIDTVDEQKRVFVNFDVMPGTLFKLDSIAYNLLDSVPHTSAIDTLQRLTVGSLDKALMHKGDPFSQYLISSELDRIADLARNNGYLKFGKEQLLAVWDTVGRSILTATTDVSEQLRQLQELRERRANPTADVEVRLRGNVDTSRLIRYYIGEVRIYPDTEIDTLLNNQDRKKIEILTKNQYKFISYTDQFKSRKLIHFISNNLVRGDLYSQSNYLKAQSHFSKQPAWRLVTINQLPRPGTDTVDFDVLLVPDKRYNASVKFDISRNQQTNFATAGNLLGLGANLSFQNKNFSRTASVSSTNFRYGVELSSRLDSIQTQQFSINHTIQFPRFVPRFKNLVPQEWREFAQTSLSTNVAFTDRIDYFKAVSLNTSWGYQFSKNKSIIGIRWPNVEYNYLQRRAELNKLIDSNASYKYIFNDGFILSAILNISNINTWKFWTFSKRFSAELSNIPGFLSAVLPQGKVYRFIKLDGELSASVKTGARKRSAVAGRLFGGLGYSMPFSRSDGKQDSSNLWMPFFRQYYAGGPTSMRAWALRRLGPGSTIKSYDKNVAPDRFGDMRLEFNLEWRIYLTQLLGSYPLETALFTDVGNVWFYRKNADFPNGDFQLNRVLNDLGVGVGTGFRVDFGFLLARFDFAWKARDPSPDIKDAAGQYKWFYHTNLRFGNTYGTLFQLGINYPF